MSRRRRWPRRLLLVPVVLVLLELALQLAAPLVQRAMARREGPPDPAAALTVLCVGDSNTYGLHLPRAYAYPALLEARLRRRYEAPVSVVNRGVPGHSATQVARHLEDDLREVRPDVVVLLAGINDTWNEAAEQGPAAWLGRLRLVRLARVLAAGVTTAGGTFEVRTEDGRMVVDRGEGARPVAAREAAAGTRAGAELATAVRDALAPAIALCRDWGATPVLMTYPDPHLEFPTVNAVLRELARDLDVPVADHARAFERHFADEGYETLMFSDHHPNLRGYRLLVDGLLETLVAAGLVPANERDGARAAREPPADARLEAAPGGRLRLHAPEGWAFQVLVGRPAAELPIDAGGIPIPLAEDEVLQRSRLEPAFSGRVGPSGVAPVTVPPELTALGPLQACAALLFEPDEGGGGVAAVLGPVPVAP